MIKVAPRLVNVDAIVMGIDEIRPKNFFFAGEMHDFWEAVFVSEGNAAATGDERFYKLNAGKLLFHKPMEFHRIWSENGTAPHLKIISFKLSGRGIKKFENACFDLNITERESFAEITDRFIGACGCSNDIQFEKYLLASNLAASLLEAFLLKLYEKETYLSVKLSRDETQYSSIVSIMKNNVEKSLSVPELAALCQMSTSNFKRIFSLYSDTGPAKYFLTLKIRKVMQLLEEGIPPINIAENLGFNEIGYFYTVFKRETGMTPSEFKNSRKLQYGDC